MALFLAVSLMNNWAFGLKVPVPIHIIFRSGGEDARDGPTWKADLTCDLIGLCVSMLMGWLVGGKRYSKMQVVSSQAEWCESGELLC